ncbi:MAG: response regulator transcription factor [Polaromonas sp.]
MKIAFVEDGLLMAEKIRSMLTRGFPLAQITSFQTLASAMMFAHNEPQEYWLVDLGLPDGTGIQLIRLVRERHPQTHILVITVFGDADNIVNSIQAGANGYLLKEDMQKDMSLVSTIDAIRRGGTPLSPLIASRLLARMQLLSTPAANKAEASAQPSLDTTPVSANTPAHGLAPREVELLLLLGRGYTYQEAAGLMAVELATVQTYVKRIYTKLAVNSRTQAIFEARVLGVQV